MVTSLTLLRSLIFENMNEYLPAMVELNLNMPSSDLRLENMTLFLGFTMKKSISLFDVDECPTKYAPLM